MVVIGPGLGTTDAVELYATFYDIFVRHAFGSFGAMLKEVTYSPAMARYLTYLDSGGIASAGTYPDENYAREVMQIFTIGLYELHPNGTYKRDAAGAARDVRQGTRGPPRLLHIASSTVPSATQ